MQKLLKLTLAGLIGAGLSVGTARAGYTPPPEDRPTGTQTAPSSSRSGSCQTANQGRLALLAPQLHLGQTASTHPSFVWYVPSQSPVSLEFRLFEPGIEGKAPQLWGRPIELTSSGGLMKLSLPQDQPGLTPGKTYLWQVALLCSPDYPSQDIVARAAIKVVAPQSSLNSKITAPSLSILEKTDLYARSGLWYDALSSALSGSGQTLVLGEAGSKLLVDLVNYEEHQLVAQPPTLAEQQEVAAWAQQLRQLMQP